MPRLAVKHQLMRYRRHYWLIIHARPYRCATFDIIRLFDAANTQVNTTGAAAAAKLMPTIAYAYAYYLLLPSSGHNTSVTVRFQYLCLLTPSPGISVTAIFTISYL